jgi:DNA primase catalytic core
MKGTNKNELARHIKENISIFAVLEKLGGLGLQKNGKEWSGNCPTFHISKSGNCFHVIYDEKDNKNFFICHSCGISGSPIDLVMMSEDIEYIDALNWFKKNFVGLEKFSINSQSSQRSADEMKNEKELRVNTNLYDYLIEEGKKKLFDNEGKEALHYLVEERNYDVELIKHTELFYLPEASAAKQLLASAFPEMSAQIKALKLIGHFEDNFRLAFPYRDRNGLITGLLKRATVKEGISGITYKGEEFKEKRFDSTPGLCKDDLFGLNRIKKKDTLIIVEGYLDAIYLFELGIDNIVAVGQGGLSKKHLVGLDKKKIKNVIIAFDNDNVGPGNTVQAVKLLLENTNIKPFVLDPKELGIHKDPDEFVRANGLDAFKAILDKAGKGVVWLIKHLLTDYDNCSPLNQQKTIDEIIEFSRLIKNPMEIEDIMSIVSGKLKTNKTVVKDMFKVSSKNEADANDNVTRGKFWSVSNNGLQISVKDYIDFIIEEGFAKYYLDKDYTFIRAKANIVKECSLPQIKDHILSYVEQMEDDESGTKRLLYETLYTHVGQYFNEGLIECIPPREIKFKRDGMENANVYYHNGFVTLKKNAEAEIYPYNKLDSPIWEHIINERRIELISTKDKKAEYEQFLFNVVGGNEQRFLSLCSAIGYMMHDYKQDSNTKAVILCDQMISDNPNGRTGKSLIGKAIEKIKNVSRVDGKNYKFTEKFTFQMVELGTQIIDFNDVEANFDFEKLFSVITDSMTVEYKNKTPFTIPFSESPKIMLSTNYTIRGEGSSFKDRMFEIEFSNHYNAEHKPKDDFGHDFFSGWDEAEWNRFDNFMLECLQLYLDEGLIGCELINLSQRKLIDQTSVQFVEFAEEHITLNNEYNLSILFTEFKDYIGFGQDMFDKCPIKQNTFTMWLPIYAHSKGAVYQKRSSNGQQKVKLSI